MKKTLIAATFASILIYSCNKKESTPDTETTATTEVVAKDTVTNADRYEGKVVMATNQQWYVIKDGRRWRTNSVEASVDYLKTLPESPDNTIKGVPIEDLQEFPEAGEIFPKMVFKEDEVKAIP